MDADTANRAFLAFLARKASQIGEPLAEVPHASQRLSGGWAFYYQSKTFVETGDVMTSLVGHGPVVIRDDGRIIEGGSLHHDPETLLLR